MSLLRKIELEKDDVLITLKLTKKEYENITPNVREFVVLPAKGFDRDLVTGRIGNGNRIMLPNKLLQNHNINVLKKNVQSKIIDLGDKKILIIELENKRTGVPVFEEG